MCGLAGCLRVCVYVLQQALQGPLACGGVVCRRACVAGQLALVVYACHHHTHTLIAVFKRAQTCQQHCNGPVVDATGGHMPGGYGGPGGMPMRPHHLPGGAPAAAAAGYGQQHPRGPPGGAGGDQRNVRPRHSGGGGLPVAAGGPVAGQAGFKPGGCGWWGLFVW